RNTLGLSIISSHLIFDMWRVLLFALIIEIVNCSCPNANFELVRDGQCRGYYTTISSYDSHLANDAVTKCKELHGQPVMVHNTEMQSYWTPIAHSVPSVYQFVIGLLCNSSSKNWQWSDGSALDYKPPGYNGALDSNCNTGCSWFLSDNDHWGYGCSSDGPYNYEIYCTTQLQQPVPSSNDCENFEDDNDDGVCYQIITNAQNWQDAQNACRNIGANLASIHNVKENSFLRRLAVSNGAVNGVFIGATTSGKGNKFGWIDGSDWDYDNFYPGFPVDGQGDCLAMDTFSSSGEWMNMPCSSKLPVACVKAAPTCASGPWKEGQVIYSPGYPYDASIQCDYFLTVAAGKKVQVEVLLLEANTCCDRLVLEDAVLGGNIVANLTGEITDRTYTTKSSNFMRVSWQPNGGVN
ncbi:hypothetical protein PENTCL1PPCAC_9072, partial [Pristionchus entomophagus]